MPLRATPIVAAASSSASRGSAVRRVSRTIHYLTEKIWNWFTHPGQCSPLGLIMCERADVTFVDNSLRGIVGVHVPAQQTSDVVVIKITNIIEYTEK